MSDNKYYELERSFFEIYDEHYDRILNFHFRNLLNKESAEDLTGNTFLKAYNYLKKNKVQIENMTGWLYRIASNELVSFYRYSNVRKDQVEYQNGYHFPNSGNKPVNGYLKFMDVKDKLKKLKPEEQLIVDMHFFQNMNYKEMSGILNIKEETLRSKVHRILKKLKDLLN
jgi:RNA polymerase sigma-70 factor, ECF subfamily